MSSPRMIIVRITDLDGTLLASEEVEVPEGIQDYSLVPREMNEIIINSVAELGIGAPDGA